MFPGCGLLPLIRPAMVCGEGDVTVPRVLVKATACWDETGIVSLQWGGVVIFSASFGLAVMLF